MHLKSCCALLLLALVACQAAPATEEKPIAEEDTLNIEETGEDKDRSKKSTTLCVEFNSGKEQQVPCNQVQQSAGPNVVYLSQPQQQPQSQTILVPAPQPTPQTHFIQVHEKQQQNVVVPHSQQIVRPSYSTVVVQPPQTIQVAPQPTVQVQTRPAAIQVQSQPSVQVQSQPSVQVQSQPSVQVQSRPTVHVQSQPTVQVHTRPSTVQVQPQPTVQVQAQPTVQVVQPQQVPQQTHYIHVQTQSQPQPQQNTVVVPTAPAPSKTQVFLPNYKVESSAPCASEVLYQPQVELITRPQVIQQRPTVIEVPQVYSVETQSEDDLYECSCHPGKQSSKGKVGKLTDILVYPGTASIVSSAPFVSGRQFLTDNSVLSGGEFVASSPVYSTSQSASRGPIVSSSASLGPLSSGSLASVVGSTPVGSVAGTASLGSVAGSASLGPVSGDASLGLLHGSASFKSPIVQYSINAGPRTASLASFGDGEDDSTEARRHKHKKVPAQLSVKIPVSTLPVTYAAPTAPAVQYTNPSSATQYYTYTNSYSYPYPPQISYSSIPQISYPSNTYYENPYPATYPNYSAAYPNSYPAETSAPSITLNASGPFYRESQHTDNTQEKSTTGIPPKEPSSPVSNIERTSDNRRENEKITPSVTQT